MRLKKYIGKVVTSKFVETGHSFYKKKKNLPGRDLTKGEKHWSKGRIFFMYFISHERLLKYK